MSAAARVRRPGEGGNGDLIAPSEWRPWSEEKLIEAFEGGEVAINQVIYAEVAVGYTSQDRLERALGGIGVTRLNLPFSAAWRVAKAFADYRAGGGPRRTPLPDFFIGAHAAASDLTLLTRDCPPRADLLPGGSSRRSGRVRSVPRSAWRRACCPADRRPARPVTMVR